VNRLWNHLRTLQPGIAVCVRDIAEPGRIEISSGTTTPSPSDGDYERGALVPTDDWREPCLDDRRMLLSGAPSGISEGRISIVKLSPEMLSPFRELRELARQRNVPEIYRQVARPALLNTIKSCTSHFRDRFGLRISEESVSTAGGVRVNAPNLRTVTVDSRTEKLIGLHVDNWSRMPLNQRRLTPQRICINLGNDVRYLLFLNISIQQLIVDATWTSAARADAGIQPELLRSLNRTASGTAVARIFMASSPRYPVIRLSVYPSEAYIAPTENIIHDGSSAVARGLDVSLSLRECAESFAATS
jgi:hypothetical protein